MSAEKEDFTELINWVSGLTAKNHHEEARAVLCRALQCTRSLGPVYEGLEYIRDFFGYAPEGHDKIMSRADAILRKRLEDNFDEEIFAALWGAL